MKQISNPIISNTEDVYNLIAAGNKLTKKFSYYHNFKTGGKTINLTLGRIWFNMLLPEDYPLVNDVINKKTMDKIIIELYHKYGTEETSNCISKLQTEAFKLASISPNTFTIDTFIPPVEWIKKKEEFQKISDKLEPLEFKKEAEKLTKELLAHFDEFEFRANNIMSSGAKGNPISDWGALLTAKGYVMDIEGNLLGPITTSLNDGYGKVEYYHAASEARKNFYIRSALSAHPGLS